MTMIGSRARGSARPDSDLDLVVLLEIPADAAPWGPAEVIAERKRLQQSVPRPPILTDLWVRTTDRYAEARGVIGGIERLVDVEGVDVFSEPLTRAPIVRRTPDQVRREHVSAWIEHALWALEGTAAMESATVARPVAPGQPRTADEASRICAERAVNALLVFHQVEARKGDGLTGMIERLSKCDPGCAAHLGKLFPDEESPTTAARRLVSEVMRRLSEDRSMLPYLGSSRARLDRVSVPTSATVRR
ncbi:MAG: nucleotidyltransferase domain-containing protein [Longimicrobiaceae bacterium]